MLARLDTLVLTLTATLTLGACDSTFTPIEVAPGCPDQPQRGPEAFANGPATQLIDDFEDGDGFIQALEGRDGLWVIGHDDTQGATVFEVSPHRNSPDCSARGRQSAFFSWSGYTGWGANLTALFRGASSLAATWDGRAYGGVSFWAALPADRAPFDLPVGIMTIDNAWNGGVCSHAAGKCMDDYGTTVHLTSKWERFEIRFDQLAQEGFGAPLTPMKRDKLVGLLFWPSRPTAIWLDDLRFEP